jgi:hypothetical protein
VVAASDVEAIVASWSGVPVERLSEDEATKLSTLVGFRVLGRFRFWGRSLGRVRGSASSGGGAAAVAGQGARRAAREFLRRRSQRLGRGRAGGGEVAVELPALRRQEAVAKGAPRKYG